MAQTAITNTKLKFNEAGVFPTAVAMSSATDGCTVDYTGKEDGRILVILENGSNTATAKILAGNGLQGTDDLEIALGASEKKCIVVESGKYVNVYGANKGKLIINGGTGIKVAAIELP